MEISPPHGANMAVSSAKDCNVTLMGRDTKMEVCNWEAGYQPRCWFQM